MAIIDNPARRCLEAGGVALGIGVRLARTVEIAPIMKASGFDWLFIDLEHGPMSVDTAAQICGSALLTGISPIIRIPTGAFGLATRLLDAGAQGIIVPHVDTAEQAQQAVDQLRYLPDGHRSFGGVGPHFGYGGFKTKDAMAALNASALLVVMLETPEAIKNANEISMVKGVDVVLIGSGDLSIEMDIFEDLLNPSMIQAYERTIEACRRHGKWPGMAGISPATLMPHFIAMGAQFILSGTDTYLLADAAAQRCRSLKDVKLPKG